ncbi:MAG: M20/M25/M40 family metallo-hydrolase [Thermoleophilia bacterium]
MSFYGVSDAERAGLERELLGVLTALLRVDTTNPPGNETACALILRDYLAANGISSVICGETPERQNLVARLRGTRPGPTLLTMGHMDVVPADASEWSVPPFAATIKDGYLWGVGTTDMKGQVAAEAVAMARLARSGADFAGELVFAATVDEEVGDHCGVRWLCQNRPELVACDYLLNEGMGGLWLPIDGKKVFLLTVGEKAFAQFRLKTSGIGGHASVPEHDHSAVINLAKAVVAVGECDPPAMINDLATSFIDVIVSPDDLRTRLKDPAQARAAARALRRRAPEVANLVEPILGATFTPTILRAGSVVNVLPVHAEADVDCRIMPGMTVESTEQYLRTVLDPLGIDYEIEWLDVTTPNESPAATPLSESIARVLAKDVPGAVLAPMCSASFTDSRHFRAFSPDTIAYGFAPYLHESMIAMEGGRDHAPDERILIDDAVYQVLFFERVTRDLLA